MPGSVGASDAAAQHVDAAHVSRLPIRPELVTLADQGELESYAADEFKPIVERLIALAE
jgi:hypothetical protein